jgi:hypothetical protein
MKAFVSTVALANLAVTAAHLFLAGKLNSALTVAGSVRIGVLAGALTLVGVGLLWTRLKRIGSFVLIAGVREWAGDRQPRTLCRRRPEQRVRRRAQRLRNSV